MRLGTVLSSIAAVTLLAALANGSAVTAVRPWDELFGVAITPAKAFIVGGDGLLLTSADTGRSWSRRRLTASGDGRPVSDRDLFSISFDKSGLHGWIAGAGGLILASNDAGKTWKRESSGTDNALFKVAATGSQSACATGENGTLECTTDGGLNWRQAQGVTPVTFFDIVFVDHNIGWAAGEFQTILNTTDGGSHWSISRRADSTSFEIPPYFSIIPATPGVLWVTEQSGGALNTTNEGRSWNAVASPSANSILAGAYSASLAASPASLPLKTLSLVGKRGTILVSADNGASWRALNLSPSDLNDIGFGNGYGLIVGMQGTILRSQDALHWSRVS